MIILYFNLSKCIVHNYICHNYYISFDRYRIINFGVAQAVFIRPLIIIIQLYCERFSIAPPEFFSRYLTIMTLIKQLQQHII